MTSTEALHDAGQSLWLATSPVGCWTAAPCGDTSPSIRRRHSLASIAGKREHLTDAGSGQPVHR